MSVDVELSFFLRWSEANPVKYARFSEIRQARDLYLQRNTHYQTL
jgi:hypothetical protein